MLIKTKIIAPPLRSGMLLRKTLIQRLSAAQDYPFTSISGPAGSGKTTLLGHWIANERLHVAWYSLDEEDNTPDLFFRYLLAALAHTDRQLHKSFRPMLENQRELTGKMVIAHLIESLANCPKDIHVVLDDFHQITNGTIHDSLARLIQYIPDNLHFVFLSRHDLPAPINAVTLKKERLAILASDLKFSEKETAALYREVIPIAFSASQIHDLHRHVEGWAAGLQLIGLSVGSCKEPINLLNILNQTQEQVAGYLIHEILRTQPEKIRDFILTTAILDRFCPEMCVEVTGMPDSEQILERLKRMNLFLVPLGADAGSGHKWYRYHHLFSEIVRRQVVIADPCLISATLRKAALWCACNNQPEDAFRMAFRSNDVEFTADLVEDHIMKYIETSGKRLKSKSSSEAAKMRFPFYSNGAIRRQRNYRRS